METLEVLNRKIKTSDDLLSVVKTMKSIAAVNVRQYEAAARAMDEYNAIVNCAWQALCLNHMQMHRQPASNRVVLLVLGSDQGMCGQFNESIVRHALHRASALQEDGMECIFWTAGERVRAGMEGEVVAEHFSLPSSPEAISELMHDIVLRFSSLHVTRHVERFLLLYNRLAGSGYTQVAQQILPIIPWCSENTVGEKWPTRCLPLIQMDQEVLFNQLFYQHIFGNIHKAFSQTLASENIARLASMQAAEKNIIEMRENLHAAFRATRQNAITEELLDIISGFEALTEK